jgi:hypothetical protein
MLIMNPKYPPSVPLVFCHADPDVQVADAVDQYRSIEKRTLLQHRRHVSRLWFPYAALAAVCRPMPALFGCIKAFLAECPAQFLKSNMARDVDSLERLTS